MKRILIPAIIATSIAANAQSKVYEQDKEVSNYWLKLGSGGTTEFLKSKDELGWGFNANLEAGRKINRFSLATKLTYTPNLNGEVKEIAKNGIQLKAGGYCSFAISDLKSANSYFGIGMTYSNLQTNYHEKWDKEFDYPNINPTLTLGMSLNFNKNFSAFLEGSSTLSIKEFKRRTANLEFGLKYNIHKINKKSNSCNNRKIMKRYPLQSWNKF